MILRRLPRLVSPILQPKPALHDRYTRAADLRTRDATGGLFRAAVESARTPHFDALANIEGNLNILLRR